MIDVFAINSSTGKLLAFYKLKTHGSVLATDNQY